MSDKKQMFMGMRLTACVALLAALPGIVCAGPPTGPITAPVTDLKGIRMTAADDGARVLIDASTVTSYHLFTLDKPDRIVIDLRNTRRAKSVRLPNGAGVIQTVRTGERPNGTLRVVLQLKRAMPAKALWMGPATGPTMGATTNGSLNASSSNAQFVVNVGRVPQALPQAPEPRFAAVEKSAPLPAVAPPPPAAPVTAVPAPAQTVRPQHAPIENDRDIVVAVDAGHGGVDPGAIGRNGTREKDVTLAIARSLAARINAEPGMRAVLIRDSDYFVVLRDRMVRARRAKADLFISIHADSIRDRSITGASVYVLSGKGASNEAARWLAERENAADLIGGVKLDDKDESLASVLLDLSQTASLSASMTAAERVLGELDRSVEVRKPSVQQAGLIVLKSPDIPSMLVETGYISNPGEESRLKSDRHQDRLAQTIFTGLRGYFEVSPPAGTRLARTRRATLAGVMAAPTTP